MILQKDSKNDMGRASKQRENIKGNDNKKGTYTQNKKQSAEIY